MKIRGRNRSMSAWYTDDNIYTLYRLWMVQRDKGKPMYHADLDKWHHKCQKERGNKNNRGTTMSQKFMHEDGEILYSVCEDLHYLLELYLMETQLKLRVNDQVYLAAVGAGIEWERMTYSKDIYLTFSEMEQLLDKIMAQAEALLNEEDCYESFEEIARGILLGMDFA